MVANIRSGSSPGGALRYNKEKLDKDKAEVLLWQKMLEPFDKHGRMDVEGLATARSEHLPPPSTKQQTASTSWRKVQETSKSSQ
ncbi:MAG: hypothetical protein BHV64_06340 [Alistipes sp. 56_sp_Nov_56_25]|nr:MAG: hypothetical protein BHV64_06340 [Alistipes sp. 56_sp_Nov_56_25]